MKHLKKSNRKQRLLCLIISVLVILSISIPVLAINTDYINVSGYDPNTDYTAKMLQCLEDGSDHALLAGAIYERQRNLKIDDMGLDYEKNYYFSTYNTVEEIKSAMAADATPEPTPEPTTETSPSYTEDDLYWLSRVVYAEAGCNWFPDWVQQAVASVVINRVNSSSYPNTIYDVIYQPGQYGCVNNGSIYNTPTQKVINNCKYVLENGSTLPSYVIGQSGYPLGPVYTQYYDSVLGTTIYFFSL